MLPNLCHICIPFTHLNLQIQCSGVVFVCSSGGPEVREQRDEHPAVQLLPPPLLAAQLHGRLYLVPTLRGREG